MKRTTPLENARVCRAVDLSTLHERASTLIPFDEGGKVTRGIYKGLCADAAEAMEVGHLLHQHDYVRRSVVTVRPWWNFWLNTRALRLVAYDAGGQA